ncbi:MAG: SGNH/GDSL hydrolase family protein [Vicinamibacterales bacterium]
MRKLLVALVVLTGALLAALLFQQIVVEGSLGPAAMVAAGGLSLVFLAMLATLVLLNTRHRALVANLWLAAFSIGISYFALDLAAGWILIRPLSPPLVPDEYRHHKLVPDSYSEFNQRDFSYVQRVNALGFRGKETTVEKPQGTYRIVMLGDSFTMGKGVEDDQTFSVLVERELNTRAEACGGHVEVINAGVDSYAPVLEWLYLTRDLQKLHPDLVVMNLDVSDLVQEQAYRHESERDATGEVSAVPLRGDPDTIIDRIRVFTEHHLFLTRVALFYAIKTFDYRELTVRDVVTMANTETVAHTLVDDVDRTDQWRTIFDSITKAKDFSKSHGMEFLLTVYPWAHQVSDTEWVPGRYTFMPDGARAADTSVRTIHEMSAANGVPLLDVTPVFRQHVGGTEHLYFDHDMHWTPAGHRVMAEGLTQYLEKTDSSRWCPGTP